MASVVADDVQTNGVPDVRKKAPSSLQDIGVGLRDHSPALLGIRTEIVPALKKMPPGRLRGVRARKFFTV
jgi:hypothetical protein